MDAEIKQRDPRKSLRQPGWITFEGGFATRQCIVEDLSATGAKVTTATTRRVVQLMPRLTHHSSAQLITTGTMISSCNSPRLVGSARTAGAACSDANSTTDLHAGVGAVGL